MLVCSDTLYHKRKLLSIYTLVFLLGTTAVFCLFVLVLVFLNSDKFIRFFFFNFENLIIVS